MTRSSRWYGVAALLLSACAWPATRATHTDELIARLRPPGQPLPTLEQDGGVYADTLSILGREDLLTSVVPPTNRCRPLERDNAIVDPLAEIVRRARAAQVVIINEAHSRPAGRQFIEEVARALRPLGYSIYAAEAFADGIGSTAPPYARSSDGFYVNEPVYGQLMRSLRGLGYTLVPYDWLPPRGRPRPSDPTDDINQREEGEAQNLVRRIFERDRNARVIIHVGYSHGRELPEDKVHWMGMRLRERTGIDPLTIDQTSYGPTGDRYVMCATDSDGSALDPAFDLTVMPPALRFEHGRPLYRRVNGRHEVPLPSPLLHPGRRTLVEVHRASEPDDAVPEDRILLEAGDDLPLLLSSGRYRVRARTIPGNWSSSYTLNIP